jgi:pyruvate dehydrogenase E2 component (dihydrolipoamide acetyltransferase)
MRRILARYTTESARTVPQFNLRTEVDVTALVEFRRERLPARAEVHPTVTDLLLKALALALHRFPKANRIWEDGRIIQLETADVGLVIALEDGLVLPVIRCANELDLYELARRRTELTALARAGRLQPAIPRGAASSLSNLGNSRVDSFTGLIAPPQSSLFSVGRMAFRPFVHNGMVLARQTIQIGVTIDHRVLDGALAAELLGQFATLLESPNQLA